MRIVILGTFGAGSLATYVSRAFQLLDIDTRLVSDNTVMPRHKWSRLLAERIPPAVAAALPRIRAHRELAKEIVLLRPDVLLVIKSPYLHPSVLRAVHTGTRARLINWMPDDPFVAMRPAVRLTTLKQYDTIITYSNSIASAIKRRLAVNSAVIPFAYDPTDYCFPGRATTPGFDVAFVGSYRPDRGRILGDLIARGLSVRVFGPRWDRAPQEVKRSWIRVASYGPAACKLYQQARVGLNILHPTNNAGSHNMRTWEIPASGVPMVTTDTDQQRQLLKGIDGIGYYGDSASLLEAVSTLARSGERPEAGELRKHTYAERCSALLGSLQ